MSEQPLYRTRDLYLGATLVCLKFPILLIDSLQEGMKRNLIGIFCFADTPLIRETELRYMQGLLAVEPKAYVSAMHSLKSKVTAMQQEQSFSAAQ